MLVLRHALALHLFLGCASAAAGPLLSATLDHSFRVGANGRSVALRVDALGATGSLAGGTFQLDAGSAFQTQRTIRPGDLTLSGVAPAFTAPVTAASFEFGRNGALSGTLGDATLTPASGITGFAKLMAKIGSNPRFTLIAVPHSVGAAYTERVPTTTSPTLLVTQWGGAWHLGVVSETGLTTGGPSPSMPSGMRAPDDRATGGISITPGGNTRITLVSLSRIRVRGLATFTDTNLARLTLVYAPEPGPALLMGAGASLLAALSRRRAVRAAIRPAPAPPDRTRSATRRAGTRARSA